jgi:pyruvate,water dikinase
LVPTDVAGVLFTADPNGAGSGKMLIEANWGLGETVVGGQAQPDVLTVDRETGRVLSAKIADKQVYLAAGTGKEQPVAESLRNKSCLSSRDVHRLWELGKRIMEHFAAPQDIEWAIHQGDLYLLQSRPITTQQEAEAAEAALCATRRRLREEMAAVRRAVPTMAGEDFCPAPSRIGCKTANQLPLATEEGSNWIGRCRRGYLEG